MRHGIEAGAGLDAERTLLNFFDADAVGEEVDRVGHAEIPPRGPFATGQPAFGRFFRRAPEVFWAHSLNKAARWVSPWSTGMLRWRKAPLGRTS